MTAQVHERLIFEGHETSMAFCPPIPTDHPQILRLTNDELREGMAAGKISRLVHSTACWREYIGTWKLEDGKFFLLDINGIYKVDSAEPIFADWVTAVIHIPEGEMLHYVHMGFGSVCKQPHS